MAAKPKLASPHVAKGDDPARGVVKTLTVEYVVGGETFTFTGTDKDFFTPKAPSVVKPAGVKPAAEIAGETAGGPLLSATQPGSYELHTASGKSKTVNVPALPAAQQITGPWQVHFDPKAGGPGDVSFAKLEDWSQRAEARIKYYSGTAVYQNTFVAPPRSANTKWILDLGKVDVMAEVKLNGKDLGILWKSPYQVDVTSALQPGENRLELKVVNLWINRQIGDENLPEDSERNPAGSKTNKVVVTLKSWPEWVQQEKPSPTGRISFTTHRLWKKGDPLSPSGLIGPVRLIPLATGTAPATARRTSSIIWPWLFSYTATTSRRVAAAAIASVGNGTSEIGRTQPTLAPSARRRAHRGAHVLRRRAERDHDDVGVVDEAGVDHRLDAVQHLLGARRTRAVVLGEVVAAVVAALGRAERRHAAAPGRTRRWTRRATSRRPASGPKSSGSTATDGRRVREVVVAEQQHRIAPLPRRGGTRAA